MRDYGLLWAIMLAGCNAVGDAPAVPQASAAGSVSGGVDESSSAIAQGGASAIPTTSIPARSGVPPSQPTLPSVGANGPDGGLPPP